MFALERLKALGAGGALAAGFLVLGTQSAAQDGSGSAGASPSHEEASHIEQAMPVAIDPHMAFERVVVGADGVARPALTLPSPEGRGDSKVEGGGVAGAGERLIYSNTLGFVAVNFPSNQPVSDDIATTAPDGCHLTRFKFKVLGRVRQHCSGGANNGMACTSPDQCPSGTCPIGGGYRVNYALYTNCLMAVGTTPTQQDVVKIPGTDGQIEFADDGPRLIEHVVPAQTPVALPTNVYLGLRFSRANCGTVVGAPASIGFSGDIWDSPGFPCKSYLGGFPEHPHASFWLEMFGSDSCADAFVAYKAQKPSGGPAALGANIQGVDDVTLIVDDCDMIGYEVAVKGIGFYTFDLRRACSGQVIVGTERTFQIGAGEAPILQIARFAFNPPIRIPGSNIFLGFKSSSNATGAVVAGISPIIGESGPDYYVHSPPSGCSPVPIQGIHGAINLAITCAGSLPTGACCDPYLTECNAGADAGKRCLTNADCAPPGTCEAVCRQTSDLNCPFPPTGQELYPLWRPGDSCDPDPFPEKCGEAACCHMRPDPQSPLDLEHVCINMTRNECEAQLQEPTPPIWQLGQYCGLNIQDCPRHECPDRNYWCKWGYCPFPYSCIPYDSDCCFAICSSGPQGAFCCNTAWDSVCCDLVEQFCPNMPSNDQCAAGYPNPNLEGALMMPMPGSRTASNIIATTDASEPGFCCNNGAGECIGGDHAGEPCIVDQDCGTGTCTDRIPDPGGQAIGTIWYKFVQPAGLTSAGISTCASNSPALDSIMQVFAATDHSSPLAQCQSLYPIACSDDAPNCSSTQRNSRVCLRNLTPGATYYIMVAAKTWNRRGTYTVSISTNCSGTSDPCSYCPNGEFEFIDPPNGVVDARRPHPPGKPQSGEGIASVTVKGPPGATDDCWQACESAGEGFVFTTQVQEHPPGTYKIDFGRAIKPGAAMVVTYSGHHQERQRALFYAHPANVNGDSMANSFDVLELIDHLNGVKALPWGLYSGDLDHSEVIGPADILTLIDLLNGASGYAAWNGTPLPDAKQCP